MCEIIESRQEEFLKRLLQCDLSLRAFIGSVVRDPHGCEDVFQDVALTLWKEYDRYDPSRPFGAWARGIAAKKLLQRWNRQGRLPISLSPEAIQAVAAAFDRTEPVASDRAEALQQCLKTLPEKSRRLLAMRYEEARKLPQIAEELQTTLDALYQALSRIRAKLQECVKRRLAAPGGAGNV